jgi:hypothetical protein
MVLFREKVSEGVEAVRILGSEDGVVRLLVGESVKS